MESKMPGPSKGYQKQIKKNESGAQPRSKPKISHSTDYSSPTAKKWPLFVDALEKGDLDAVKKLIEEGINVNVIRDGVSPLMVAASKGKTEIAEIILQAGANINEKNDDNWTALHKAAFGQAETGIVQFLMESGIDIEAKNKSGKTALLLAEEKKHRDITRVIRAYQAKLQAEAKEWEDFLNTPEGKPYKLSSRYDSLSPLFKFWWVPIPLLACVGLMAGLFFNRSILSGVAGLVSGFCIGGSILFWSKKLRAFLDDIGPLPYLDIHMVRQKRKAGEPITIEKHSETQFAEQGMDGQSADNAAERSTDNFLLERTETQTVDEQRPVGLPALHGKRNLNVIMFIASALAVIILIIAGVVYVYKDAFMQWYFTNKLENSGIPFSEQAFLAEVSRNHEEAVDLFMKGGVNLAAKNEKGQTALMISAEKGYATILQKIILQNASALNNVDKNGNTALMMAARQGREPIVKMLVESGADINYLVPSSEAAASALQAAVDVSDAKAEHINIIQYLLQHGADAKGKNASGRFPLLFAADHGRTEVAKLLIEKGADVNDADAKGNFPLLTAACKGHSGLLTFLAEQGSNMKMTLPPDGQTPLMCAAEQGHIDAVKALLSQGVMVDAKTSSGFTALTAASRKGNVEVAKLLLEHGADPGSGYIPDSFANLPGKVITISGKKNKIDDLLKRVAKTASQDGYTIKVDANTDQRTTITAKGRWNKVLQELATKSRLLLIVNDNEVIILPATK
jgi:ankyrin repeat protein